MSAWADRQRDAQRDFLEMQQDALTRPCPPEPVGCGRPAGEPCVNFHTGDPLEKLPAHPSRSRKPKPAGDDVPERTS